MFPLHSVSTFTQCWLSSFCLYRREQGTLPQVTKAGLRGPTYHSPSRTYCCTFCPYLLKLPSSGGLCTATGLYIISAYPGANRFKQTKGSQAIVEANVSETLQKETANLEAMTIFRVAESAGDCVGCGEEKQTSRQPRKSFLENQARPKSRKTSDNFPDALLSRCVWLTRGQGLPLSKPARHLFFL